MLSASAADSPGHVLHVGAGNEDAQATKPGP